MVLRLVLLATLLLVSPVWATDYWVDPDNGDNAGPGSEAEPWETITKANGVLVGGDTVYLVAGGTHIGDINPTNSGDGNGFIVYEGDVTDIASVVSSGGIDLGGADNISIRGISFSGGLDVGANSQSSAQHDSITWCYLDGGIFTKGADYLYVMNCRIGDGTSPDRWVISDGGSADYRSVGQKYHDNVMDLASQSCNAHVIGWANSDSMQVYRNLVELNTMGVSGGGTCAEGNARYQLQYNVQYKDSRDNKFLLTNSAVGDPTGEYSMIYYRDGSSFNSMLRDTILQISSAAETYIHFAASGDERYQTSNTFTDCVFVVGGRMDYQFNANGSIHTGCVYVSAREDGQDGIISVISDGKDSLTFNHGTFIQLSSSGQLLKFNKNTTNMSVSSNIFYKVSGGTSCSVSNSMNQYHNFGGIGSNAPSDWNLFFSPNGVQDQSVIDGPCCGPDYDGDDCYKPGEGNASGSEENSEWGDPRFAGVNQASTISSIVTQIQAGTNPFALLEGSAAINASWPDGYVGAIGYTTPATCGKRTGVDIYASPSGSGCDGESAANPIALETANAIAGPGCTVYLLGGDYEGSIYPLYSGTSDDPIVYMAAQDLSVFRDWTTVQHIKIARPYVRVRGIEARGGIYFSHYADTTSDGSSVRKAPTPYGSPDSVVVGAFQDSVSHCNAKYLVFSGADNCYAFQDSIDIGTESDLEAVRFTASDTTAKNTADGAKASTRNTLAQSWVDADSLSNDETFFLVSNSLNDSLSRVVANFNFGAGDSFTVSNGLKIQRAKGLSVFDCRWNVERYDEDDTGAKGYDTWALSIQDSVVDAVFRRDSIYANSLTSLNDDDDFRVWASLSTNEAAGQWYQASGSQQNTWRNCFYKLGGTIRATNMTQGTIDSSVFISRYGTALWMPGSSSGDIRYNTLIGRSRAMEFNSAGNTGWGPFDARIFYNIFYADDVTQSWKDTTFIGEVVVKIDTIWTGAPVYVGTGDNPKMNFNLFYGRKVNAYGNPQAPAVNPGTNSLTAQQHAMRYTAGGYPSNGSSLWGNPSFTDSLVPFASDVKWDSLGGTRDAVKPLGNTWAADTRWEQGYAGARVPNEAVGPSQITDLEMFVSFDEEPSLTLTWTATGDTIDGSQPAFIELAYSYSSPDSFLPTPVAPPITPANFTAYRTSVTRVPAMAAGETQFLAIPPIYIRQVGSNRYFIRVVDRFGNYGYSNRSVVWGN